MFKETYPILGTHDMRRAMAQVDFVTGESRRRDDCYAERMVANEESLLNRNEEAVRAAIEALPPKPKRPSVACLSRRATFDSLSAIPRRR